jgi:hypothetical protein
MKKILMAALLVVFASCKAPKAEPIAASVFFHFDAPNELAYWDNVVPTNETLSFFNTDPLYIEAGAGSVKCACSLSETSNPQQIGIFFQQFSSNQNLTNRTVTIWVYVPADLAALTPSCYNMDLIIQRASMTNQDTFYGPALNTAGWNQVKYVIPAYSTDTNNSTHDYHDVSIMYFAIENNTSPTLPAPWSGAIYFDELSW